MKISPPKEFIDKLELNQWYEVIGTYDSYNGMKWVARKK